MHSIAAHCVFPRIYRVQGVKIISRGNLRLYRRMVSGCMQMLNHFIVRDKISQGFWYVGMVSSGFPIRGVYVYCVYPLGFLEMTVSVYVMFLRQCIQAIPRCGS